VGEGISNVTKTVDLNLLTLTMENKAGIAPLPVVLFKAEKRGVNANFGALLVNLVRITGTHPSDQWYCKIIVSN
jgi:hypothetical protein